MVFFSNIANNLKTNLSIKILPPLITNALKFHRKDIPPKIKIHAQLTQTQCTLFVQDNGIGFDEKYLGKIFTIFQRLHGRQEYEGTGVGLAVCRRIVERHGGTITAKSKLNEGACFEIRLPLKQTQTYFEETTT